MGGYLNDSFRIPQIIDMDDPALIACASIYLASRGTDGIKLPNNPPWYTVFGAKLEDIKKVSRMILEIYTLPRNKYHFQFEEEQAKRKERMQRIREKKLELRKKKKAQKEKRSRKRKRVSSSNSASRESVSRFSPLKKSSRKTSRSRSRNKDTSTSRKSSKSQHGKRDRR